MNPPNKGLTLSEIIVALGLITTAALALIAAFLGGYRMMTQSTNLSMATEVGRELLETIKSNGYESTMTGDFDGRIPDPATVVPVVAGVPPYPDFPPAPYPTGVRDGQEYRIELLSTQHSDTTRLLRVLVHWGEGHHTSLATIIHK